MDLAASIRHQPVMQQELCDWLLPHHPGVLVDCTLGGGGHTRAFLQAEMGPALVIGLDRDPDCIMAAQQWGHQWEKRFVPVHGDFRDLASHLDRLGQPQVDAIMLDLGVSSYQLDTASRGFSFQQDGPLDMRMDPTHGPLAADVVNGSSEGELRTLFRDLGEERRWRAVRQAPIEVLGEGNSCDCCRRRLS